MATVKNLASWFYVECPYVSTFQKYEHNSTYCYWVRMTSLFSPSEALYGNQIKILHWFWKSLTRATIWDIIHTCNILGKLCNLIRKMGLKLWTPFFFNLLIIFVFLKHYLELLGKDITWSMPFVPWNTSWCLFVCLDSYLPLESYSYQSTPLALVCLRACQEKHKPQATPWTWSFHLNFHVDSRYLGN